MDKKSILFLCTHNSARSQLAEALMRHRFSNRFDVYSAGTEATFVKPHVLTVLNEWDIDASGQTSKTTLDLEGLITDIVVTVCDDARENCPFYPGRDETIHRSFSDPSNVGLTEDERVEAFRRTRDEIDAWLIATFGQDTFQDAI